MHGELRTLPVILVKGDFDGLLGNVGRSKKRHACSPWGTSKLTLLLPMKLCARPMMVLCRLASPWWYAVSADTKPDSCAT
jgi:hypothetical protein